MNTGGRSILRTRHLPVVLLLTMLAAAGGCQLHGSQRAPPPTHIDRLIQAYPALQSGRFAVIADFEDPKHMELFQLIGVSNEAKCVLDHKGGRKETGTGCLLLTAGSPDDTVVINNTPATQWYLKRDWRPYDLLLMSIRSPERTLAVEITIAGGPPDERLAAHASISLQRGWNVVRLDLAEIGDRVPLDDVQEIRLAVFGASKPVDVRFDDILLSGNRKDLFGDSGDRNAGLYVQHVGRRWKIGAGRPGADFELTFANGQIVEWYNLAADPYRLRNLVRGTTLGPSPVVVGSPNPDRGDFEMLGKAVVVRPRILEMNAVRAVVACEWRFVDDSESASGTLDHRPFQGWVYTIYPTGQIYVAVEATAATGSWSVPQLGLAVTLSSTPEEKIQTYVSTQGEEPETLRPPAFATARCSPQDALLLYVADDANRSVRMAESTLGAGRRSTPTDRTSFVAIADKGEVDVERWVCHILLGSASEVSDEEALARAIDYARPVAPRLELGTLVSTRRERHDRKGFDPASGCFVIAPDKGCVRFVIEGNKQARFSPAFKIINTSGQDAWVYVDDLILDPVARDAHGNLIFQLPGVVRKPTVVEVLFRLPGRLEGA